MEPINVTYDISRCYIKDQQAVLNPALFSKIDGFLRSRNLAGLAACSSHFDWKYHTVDDWRVLRQVEAFFKKNSAFSNKEVCADAARTAFMAAEEACAQTNLRLDYFYVNRDLLDPDVDSKISRMERYIRNVLGDFRPFLNEIPRLVKVTPGATAHAPRRKSLPQMKMGMKPYAVHGASEYLRSLYQHFGLSVPRIRLCESNRVELVPKNWKTDRTIACEPEGCLPFQLAFDTYAKRRLRRKGIDLRDQSANQRRAREASVNNKYVTVDFKAASDTIAFNAVAWCFPHDWFEFLCRMRSPKYRGAFGDGTYQKFSSMGNGCTFTIETLLFAAACYAVGSKDFLVYGDDVIIEKEVYPAYLRLTRFLGFTVNEDKTFSEGPFRESCGFDAFNGIDVTPVYIRGVDSRKASLCHLVNTLASLIFPNGHLEAYLHALLREYKLPFVPYQENTLSGVWIDPVRARDLKILNRRYYNRTRPNSLRNIGPGLIDSGIDEYKSYVAKSRRRSFVDARGYYLWFLNKNEQVLFSGPWELSRSITFEETSSVPIFEHYYVRKWVSWLKPRHGIPVHLNWWTDLIAPPK